MLLAFIRSRLLIISLAFASSCASLNGEFDDYLNLLNQYPQTLGPWGDHTKHEIEIVRDPAKILEISAKTGRKAGIVHKDKYWIWLNDVVQFPNGSYGIYSRISWLKGLTGSTGVAVLIVSPKGNLLLNRNYRHATRSWEYELPRGLSHENEAPEATALREVAEETGWHVNELHHLGEMVPDSGICNARVQVFLAKAAYLDEAQPEDSEVIVAVDEFSLSEVKNGLIQNKLRDVNLRDPFLTYALLQAMLRGLL